MRHHGISLIGIFRREIGPHQPDHFRRVELLPTPILKGPPEHFLDLARSDGLHVKANQQIGLAQFRQAIGMDVCIEADFGHPKRLRCPEAPHGSEQLLSLVEEAHPDQRIICRQLRVEPLHVLIEDPPVEPVFRRIGISIRVEANNVERIIRHELHDFAGPEHVAKRHVQREDFCLGIGLVDGFAGGGQELRVVLHVAFEITQVRLVPDLPVVHLARIALDRRSGECRIRLHPFLRLHVIKFRVIRQVTEDQQTAPAALRHQFVVAAPVVFAFVAFDSAPGEVLAPPFDPGRLHGLEAGIKIRRAGIECGIDAER